MCLMLENMSEIPAFVKLGKELDAAAVHLFHLNEGADYQCGWFHLQGAALPAEAEGTR
jgi:MoaA/NifB/PqqE/SkfB family radical SAM enzyme